MLPSQSFNFGNVSVPEGDKGHTFNVLIPITRADANARLTLTVTLREGTARSGTTSDFRGGRLTRKVTFDIGVMQRSLLILINADVNPGGDEYFTAGDATGNARITILGE